MSAANFVSTKASKVVSSAFPRPSLTGINTPRKFRSSLRYLRQMLVGTSPQVMSDGDQGLQSNDDRDSGVRTSSEPTSPLTSEVENDAHLVSNFIAQLPSPAPAIADVSQHRHVTTARIACLFCWSAMQIQSYRFSNICYIC